MARYQSYIVCTSPRSGSTLLCGLLAATGIAGLPDSHFHRPSVPTWLDTHNLSDQQFSDELEALNAVFDAAIRCGTGDTGMFGLRMQWHSFEFFRKKLNCLHPALPSDADRMQAVFGATLFIHLTRPQKLEQAISRVIAEQTGLWHRAADGTEMERLSAPQEPVYDAAAISHHLAELTAFDEGWDGWFKDMAVEPLRISYDELSRDPQATLAGILEALGLDVTVADGLATPTAKLADDVSQAWAARFRAREAQV